MSQPDVISSPGMPSPLRCRRRVAPTIVTAAAAAVTILVAVVAYRVYVDRPVTATGTVTITENVLGSRTCMGMNGDEDLRKGAAVVIRAPSNQLIASGWLDEGVGGNMIAGNAQTAASRSRCPACRARSLIASRSANGAPWCSPTSRSSTGRCPSTVTGTGLVRDPQALAPYAGQL